jgi:uncharacterized Fe-S cluster protein YjdI
MQVKWDQERCCHAGVCVRPLPEVFEVEGSCFVIDADKASDEAITHRIDPCPSGAPQGVDE